MEYFDEDVIGTASYDLTCGKPSLPPYPKSSAEIPSMIGVTTFRLHWYVCIDQVSIIQVQHSIQDTNFKQINEVRQQ